MATGSFLLVVLILIGLFGGLEIGPLIARRDTLQTRLVGIAAGAVVIAPVLSFWWSRMVGAPVVVLGSTVLWFCVFAAGLVAIDWVARRTPTAGIATLLAACAGSALAAMIVMIVARGAGEEWAYMMGLPPYPVPAALSGAFIGLWIGLREILPSKLGARGELDAGTGRTG